LSEPSVVQNTDVLPPRLSDNRIMEGAAIATQAIEHRAQRSAADLEAGFPGRYLSVTSFRRDGAGVATSVWFVSDGRRLFALTDLHSAKVRRMRRNPHVLVAPCRYRLVMLSTASGAASDAGAAWPTAPRWRSQSNSARALIAALQW
jgi:hypothetical protein